MLWAYTGDSGAAPGCLLRRGGGAKCLATAARAQKYCASPWKKKKMCSAGEGGGDSDTFFPPDFKKICHKIIIMAMTAR